MQSAGKSRESGDLEGVGLGLSEFDALPREAVVIEIGHEGIWVGTAGQTFHQAARTLARNEPSARSGNRRALACAFSSCQMARIWMQSAGKSRESGDLEGVGLGLSEFDALPREAVVIEIGHEGIWVVLFHVPNARFMTAGR